MNEAVIEFLSNRRSSKPALLAEPGPNAAETQKILTIAARVPDHKKLVPWRFIVFDGAARAAFGKVLADICSREVPDASEMRLDTERARFTRAPVVIAVISSPAATGAVPEIEQTLSAGAACFNLCLAANALGYGTSWITEWTAFSPGVHQALSLGQREAVAGFVYIGTATEHQPDRERPELGAITTHWHQ